MKYYVVAMDEDGEWYVNAYDTIEDVMEDYKDSKGSFVKSVDDYHSGNMLIHGQVLMPQTKEVVKTWEFKPVEEE